MSKLPAAVLSLLLILVVSMILIVNTIEREREFIKNQRDIQEAVVHGAGYAAVMQVLETKKMVALFLDEYKDLITHLSIYPYDESVKTSITERLKSRFSNFFTFTITTPEGLPVLTNFDTAMGEVCQRDVTEFVEGIRKGHSNSSQNLVTIHPRPFHYHFDVMVPFTVSGVERVFLVGFYPTVLAEIAKTHAPPGHQLVFVHKENDSLIEIAAGGTRDKLKRDIHLSADELSSAKVSQYIDGSMWRLIDIADPQYFQDYREKLWTEVMVIIGFVTLLSVIMLLYMLSNCRDCSEQMKKR
jgi:hypothetical protein